MRDKIRQLLASNLAVRQQVREHLNMSNMSNVEGDTTTIYLYDVISNDPYWGFTSLEMAGLLNKVETPNVTLRINSPGGSAFDGRTMATLVSQCTATVHVKIDGLCASAATTVALAGDTIEMAEGGMFMIHEASTVMGGTKNDFRKVADELEKLEEGIVNDYMRATGESEETIKQWIEDETFFTASEALEAGFVDSVWAPEQKEPANQMAWDVSAFNPKVPVNSVIHIPQAKPKAPVVNLGAPENLKRQAKLLVDIC